MGGHNTTCNAYRQLYCTLPKAGQGVGQEFSERDYGVKQRLMRTILLSTVTVFLSSQLMANEAPACPDRGNDPNKFCPVGMIWSEEAQQCLAMV